MFVLTQNPWTFAKIRLRIYRRDRMKILCVLFLFVYFMLNLYVCFVSVDEKVSVPFFHGVKKELLA